MTLRSSSLWTGAKVSVASVAIGSSLSEIEVARKTGETVGPASSCGGHPFRGAEESDESGSGARWGASRARRGMKRHSPFLSSGSASGAAARAPGPAKLAASTVREVPGARHTEEPSTAGQAYAVVIWVR